ncbi:MAG TPA: Ig-like domain-containing protein, partial [Solirubrobacteraceae bacterium]|nr:Ig-like domain-containing protein [Solirubrobacteraceae bacterium]
MTLRNPANGSTTSDNTPTFSGTGGTASGDQQKVTVKVYAGTSISGSPVQTLTATMSRGNWSVTPTHALADGAYTAQAQQSDAANNTGLSNTSTFNVQTKAPPPPATYSVGGSVSGASGTVVLQDNGGDDLSVSANGSFAFATKIAS